ncbi:MAG: N-acetylneuraminate synthase [Pelagibacterales bacterium]|nr:N-acetylneuraminate synthase [Pelagibacterales bacterium]|tara:strand:+ start:12814 stop:13833 length:1020 start_codon:yes stop_codon:yes gene_type:complete
MKFKKNNTFIIAEAGINHNGKLSIAKKMVKIAKCAGANCIKFQAFNINNLVSNKAKSARYQLKETNNNLQKNVLQNLTLSKQNLSQLYNECKKQKIEFLCTAFDKELLKYLVSLGMKKIKIPSGEITNFPYLIETAKYNIPIILSTGMSNMQEIKKAYECLKSVNKNVDISILHCTSLYPAPNSTLNLKAISSLSKKFKCTIGYSDHSKGNYASIAAVSLGAKIIEKHFTLNKNYSGPDQSASANPKELKDLIENIRNLEKALGDGIKIAHKLEKNTADVARRSWHANNNIAANSKIKLEDLILLRPGTGIESSKKLIGLKTKKNIKKGEIIKLSWLSQ